MRQASIKTPAAANGYKVERCGLELYNLDSDADESKNVASQHPDFVNRLQDFGGQIRLGLGDSMVRAIDVRDGERRRAVAVGGAVALPARGLGALEASGWRTSIALTPWDRISVPLSLFGFGFGAV